MAPAGMARFAARVRKQVAGLQNNYYMIYPLQCELEMG
jgi:hypothetical protein